jgi:uncharacterized protein YdhG (YjbR/CyaY superfamily)
MSDTTTVDEYLAGLPDDARSALERLRRIIRAAAPEATEIISYGIPAYKQHGLVAGFAASAKNHLTFHVMSPEVIRAHADDLKGHDLNAGSVRFTADKPLPEELVTKLVKARVAEAESTRKR